MSPALPLTAPQPFTLRGDHITLDALLKATGVCDSGGAAKQLIAAGEVRVDGETELRRARKLRAGMRVEVAGHFVLIEAQPQENPKLRT